MKFQRRYGGQELQTKPALNEEMAKPFKELLVTQQVDSSVPTEILADEQDCLGQYCASSTANRTPVQQQFRLLAIVMLLKETCSCSAWLCIRPENQRSTNNKQTRLPRQNCTPSSTSGVCGALLLIKLMDFALALDTYLTNPNFAAVPP
ncbi:hypothetical protein TNCT_349381 [Trichonephila clavata]|uniref:Uncharacterized protein n=1 Tax=Trichonephila clavata TaxID=2740835 RepID=A0A8X6GI13_TRICU|nr:hypothetical protein TNCT_349381 [Trichonephila clavata]